MSKKLEELKGFQPGIISSSSTSDIPKESATHSLNIDGNINEGNLTGIYDSKILTQTGWREKRYSKYTLELKAHSSAFATSVYDYKYFIWETYNNTYFCWFNDDNNVTDFSDNQVRKNFYDTQIKSNFPDIIDIKISTNGTVSTEGVAVKIVEKLSSLGPSEDSTLYSEVSNTWFNITRSSSVLTFTSNFLGSSNVIEVGTNNFTISSTYFTVNSLIVGNGIIDTNLDLSWVHFLNDNVTDVLIGITKFNQLMKVNDVYSLNSTFELISSSLITDGLNNISAQNRNNNLYIGTGNSPDTKSKWFGRIKRTQLGRELEGQYLEDSELKSPERFFKAYDFDNVVVPTLHSGMNSTNSMIAGSASLYGDGTVGDAFGGDDVDAEDFSGNIYRSLNGWVMQCLKNAGIAFRSDLNTDADDDSNFHWSCVREGMILRVSIGDDNVDQAYSAYHAGTPADGTAVKELRKIKEFGYCDISAATANTEGMELHDGDLFQIISVPSGAATGHDSLGANVSYGNSNTYPRLMYVGSLNGDNTDHNSTDAYVPAPAWAYAHHNDDSVLHRISLAECRDSTITSAETLNTFSTAGATGGTISSEWFNTRVTSVDLSHYLPNKFFKIGTISQCMSTDGEGGIAGRTGSLKKLTVDTVTRCDKVGAAGTDNDEDVYVKFHTTEDHSYMIGDWVTIDDSTNHDGTWQIIWVDADEFVIFNPNSYTDTDNDCTVISYNRNFYAGHGKLWVSGVNEDEERKLYIVDVTNWTKIDIDKPRISFKEVYLNFTRIHQHLTSSSEGVGLLEEFRYSNGEVGEKPYIDSSWNPNPKDCFIGAICETYSHQPHLDDGASNANGKGRWRVWTAYQKKEDSSSFIDWELFLYNFRPTDINELNENATTAYMYDKTPPYQVCGRYYNAAYSGGELEQEWAAYYPKGKFFLQNNTPLEAGERYDMSSITNSAWGQLVDDGTPDAGNLLAGYFHGWHGLDKFVWNDGKGLQEFDNSGSYTKYSNLINAGSSHTNCEGIRKVGLHLKLKNTNHAYWKTTSIEPSLKSASVEDDAPCIWSNANNLNYNTEWWGNTYGAVPFQNPTIKDPSGYWHILESPKFQMTNDFNIGNAILLFNQEFHFGNNLGWYKGENSYGRSWQLERHCMVPYYNKWYWTGDGSTSEVSQDWGDHRNSSDTITDSKVAHIVQFVGKLKGEFVEDGGYMSPDLWYSNGTCWSLGTKNRTSTRVYDDWVLQIMHDSPVAFSPAGTDSVTGSTLTDWSGDEVQGRPTIHTDDTSNTAAKKDVLADYLTDKSVKASLGYSGYNQYRWGHQNNGTADISTDKKTADATNDTWNTYSGYYGQDGYGHYNMVTTSWDNIDIGYKSANWAQATSYSSYIPINGCHSDMFKQHRMRFHNMYWAHDTSGNDYYHVTDSFTSSDGNDSTYTLTDGGEGAGYYTYYANRDSVTSTGGAWDATITPGTIWNTLTGEHRGFYPSNHYEFGLTSGTDGDLPAGSTDNGLPFGTPWDSRRINSCWSIVNEGTHLYHRLSDQKHTVLTNPRCTFRILEGFKAYDEQNSVERIKSSKYYGIDRAPIHWGGRVRNGLITYSKIIDTADDAERTKVSVYFGQEGSSGGIKTPIESHFNLQDKHFRPFYQSADKNARAVYYNNKFIAKNLCESIFHKGNSYDIYSPIIVGDNKDNTKTSINTWRRSSWATLSNTLTDLDNVTAPYYNFDRFFNAAALDDDAHGGLDNVGGGATTLTNLINRFPTESIGSHAGTNSSDTDTVSGAAGDAGSHEKTTFDSAVSSESFTATDDATTDTDEFNKDDIIEYKISYLYDGFQDSPLSKFPHVHLGGGTNNALTADDIVRIRLTLRINSAQKSNLNKRITDIIVWRRNNGFDEFRYVDQISFKDLKQSDINDDGYYVVNIDDKKAFESYENTVGISSSTSDTSVNYRLSAQVEDFMFVADTFHPKFDDTKNIIFRSKDQGRFSMFDWKNDFLAMPERPLALAAFGGKLYVFTREKLYRVNPSSLFVESVMEGVGILNQNCVVVTDYGMFFCDANNMYHHNGTEPNIISGTVSYNQDNPEWATGYKRAVNRAIENDFNILVQYDGRNHCVYFIIRGYSEGVSSYVSNKSRAFCYSIKTGRFDIMEMVPVICSSLGKDGDVLLIDNHQITSFRKSLTNKKKWEWHSKLFDMGSISVNKVWKSIKIAGSPTIANLNGNEFDDILVYVDGVQKNMTIENKNWTASKPIAGFTADQNWNGLDNRADTGAIYALSTALPGLEETTNGLTNSDSFSLLTTSMPEFVSGEETVQNNPITEGEIETLKYISTGQYLLMEINNSITNRSVKEIVKVSSVYFIWNSDNTISRVEVKCERGQLGTQAFDFESALGKDSNWEHASIRYIGPSLKFPTGTKGSTMQLKLKNQQGEVESISFIYRMKTLK